MVRLETLLITLALLVVACPARAQVKGAPRLVFSTPPGCGDEATFRHMEALFFDRRRGATKPDPPPAPPEPAKKPPDPIPFKTLSSWAPPPMAPESLRRSDPSPPPPSPAGRKVDLAIGLSGLVLMESRSRNTSRRRHHPSGPATDPKPWIQGRCSP